MSNASGRNRFPIDAALVLLDTTAAPATANTDSSYYNLVTTGAYWQNPADVQDGSIELVCDFGAFGGTNATVSLEVVLCDAPGVNPVIWGTFPIASGAVSEIALDQVGMLKRSPTATVFKVTLLVGGTSPSIPVFMYLSTRSPI